MQSFTVCALLLTLFACRAAASKSMEILYKWKSLEFEFPSHHVKEKMIRNKEYIPGMSVPIDVDTWQRENDKRVFMTIPKFKDGIPASLVTVSDKREGSHHLVKPYPDWSWHTKGCEGITSAFRTQIDKCGRLWVIDSGMVDLFKSPRRRLCQPQLLAFSLRTDTLAGKYKFPNHVLHEGSILVNVAIDVRDPHDTCSETFAYVADVTGFRIIVYDVKRSKSWAVPSNTMYPYPPQGIFKTNGIEFDLMDGVIGLALTPLQNGDRTLYYHSFASIRESWVSTSVLRNESLFSSGFNTAPRQFKTSLEARSSQAAPQAFDRNGILYYGPVGKNAITCWNQQKKFTTSNTEDLIRDNDNLQFTTGLKIIETENGEEELWVLTDRFQLVMVNQMNKHEVNFRILRVKINDLTKGSSCAVQSTIAFPHKPVSKDKPYRRPGYGSFH